MISLHPKIKRALITGGSRGIGLAAARRLIELGTRVYYVSRQPSSFRHPAFCHIPADLAQCEGSVQSIVDALSRQDSPPDALICAAGAIQEALIPRQDDTALREQLHVNMIGHQKLIRWAVGPMMMQRFGRIVAVSSTAARFPAPGQAVYAAAKAGLEAYLKACAVEFARKGITCNWVVPGYIQTDFASRYLAQKDLKRVVPVGRAGLADEVAHAMLLFLGEHSDYLTGSRIVVDGGLSLSVK